MFANVLLMFKTMRWLGILAVFFVSYSWGQDANYPPDIRNIIKRGELRVAMVANDQIPFFFDDNGVLKGTDVDLANGIANSLGVKLVINREAKSFNDLIPLVLDGKVDLIISKLSRTLKRSQQALFSEAYRTFYQALAVNRVMLARVSENDTQTRKYIKNFRGKIGVITGSSYINYARLFFPQAEIVEYPEWDDVINAVVKGEILAAYRDEFEIKKALRTNPDLNLSLKLVLLTDLRDDIAIALNWSSANLRDFVNIYLRGYNQQTIDEIFLEYGEVLKQHKIEVNR